jgi:serine/threonine-protein kinase
VEAAAQHGEVVGFRLVPPWDLAPVHSGATAGLAANALRITIQALMLLVGGALAWLHLRAGRADLAGAARFTGVYALASFGLWVAVVPRTANLSQQFGLYCGVAGLVLHDAATLALAYVALEPFVRRLWPEVLIGWARLLAGRWRDPWVGRDLLIGAAAGAVWAAGTEVARSAAGWLGFPPEVPHASWIDVLEHPLCWAPAAFIHAVELGLLILFALFVLARALRKSWLWYPATMLVGLTLYVSSSFVTPVIPWVVGVPLGILASYVLLRCGLLALISLLFTVYLAHASATTYDLNTWSWRVTVVNLGGAAAVALYGLVVSVGGWRGLTQPGEIV